MRNVYNVVSPLDKLNGELKFIRFHDKIKSMKDKYEVCSIPESQDSIVDLVYVHTKWMWIQMQNATFLCCLKRTLKLKVLFISYSVIHLVF